MTGSAGACGSWMAAALCLLGAACAGPEGLAGGSGALGPGVRTAPDDSDLLGVVPAGAETLIELDMVALRASPWARAAFDAMASGQQAEQTRERGFDELVDVDRAVFAGLPQPGGPMSTLVIAQGRFDAGRVVDAFRSRAPAAVEDRWRDVSVWHEGERSVALLTSRTFLAGPLPVVRAAIDCAFGVAPDVRSDRELAEVRRLAGHAHGGAVRAALVVSDEMRARIGNELGAPTALRRVGARIALDDALVLQVVGMLDTDGEARGFAAGLAGLIRGAHGRPVLAFLGLASLLDSAQVAADGAHVRAELRIPGAQRADLAGRFAALAQMLAAARAQPTKGPPP